MFVQDDPANFSPGCLRKEVLLLLLFLVVLGIEAKESPMVGKHCAIKSHPQTSLFAAMLSKLSGLALNSFCAAG